MPAPNSLRRLSLSILMALAAPSWGETSDDTLLDDIPIVLTASRLSQPVNEAPVAITVIDRQMIKDSGAWDLSEIFRLVPGMYVAYHADPYYSADSTVAYHGLVTTTMSNRMQVLIDGRSVYSNLYGGVNWSDLPITLQDIEKIEVIRGPASASYGANSFSGVINIITREPAEAQGKSIAFAVGTGRSEGIFQYGGKYGALAYRMTASIRSDQGEDSIIQRPAPHAAKDDEYWTHNKFDNKNIQNLLWHGDYQINQNDSLEMQAGFNGGPREVGETDNFYASSKKAQNHFEMLHWRRALENGGELSVQAFHTQERIYASLQDSDGTSDGNALLRRYDIEVQHTFSPSDTTRLVWGGSLRYDKTYAPYYLGVGDNQYLYDDLSTKLQRAFANLEWRAVPNTVINIGGMIENNSYTGTDVTPRFAVNWQFTPGHTLRMGYTEATRTPSVYEKVYEEYWRGPSFYPNLPTLQPERVQSSEIGYMGKIYGVDIDFRLFNDENTDLIDVKRKQSAKSGNLNAGSAHIRGYEMQLKWPISSSTHLIYALSGGGIKSDNVNGVVYSDSIPTTTQSWMLTHQFDEHWRGSVTGYQVGKTHFNATDFNIGDGRAYYLPLTRRWDARLGYQFTLAGKRAELAVIGQNIADVRYFEYRHDSEVPGKQVRVSFKLDL